MGCDLLIPYVKYESREEKLKILGNFTSIKTIGVTYWFVYLSLIMHRLFTHVKTLKRKENQCSHWFLEKTKIMPVHTDVPQEPLVVNWRCFLWRTLTLLLCGPLLESHWVDEQMESWLDLLYRDGGDTGQKVQKTHRTRSALCSSFRRLFPSHPWKYPTHAWGQ